MLLACEIINTLVDPFMVISFLNASYGVKMYASLVFTSRNANQIKSYTSN